MSSSGGNCGTKTSKMIACTAIGLVFCVLGTALILTWPMVVDSVIKHELPVTPTSRSYSLWKVTPIPMYIEFYIFNWTNSKDIRNPNSKPILEELGPFVFREHREKVINQWFSINNTVTYRQNRTWVYEPSLSNGCLDDLITTLNVPAITAAYAVRDFPGFVKAGLNLAMKILRTKYYVTKSVREFIFDGYSDPLLDLARYLPKGFKTVSIPFDKFGWFYTRNGSADYDGIYNMQTGVGKITDLGVLSEWDYNNVTAFYQSYCGHVNGSAGELFPPNRDRTKIALFSSDICRTLTLTYKEDVAVHTIDGYRYWGDDKMLANATDDPDNWCFCGNDGKQCYPTGILNVTACKWGAPAFLSFPHFYHADSSYRSAVEGLNPDEHKHQTYIDLEPKSGIPLQVSAAFQINILLQPMEHYGILDGMPKIFFPMVWFKQTALIDNVIGSQIKLLLLVPMLGNVVGYIFVGVGATFLIITLVIFITNQKKSDDERTLLVSSDCEEEEEDDEHPSS